MTRLGPTRPQDGAATQRLEGWREREGVCAPDDGELARRRRFGARVDPGDPASGLVRHVDGVQLARQRRGERLALSQAAHHVRLRRDLIHAGDVGEPALGQPSAAVGERLPQLRGEAWRVQLHLETAAAGSPTRTWQDSLSFNELRLPSL
jgi:hypothetical protein